MIKKVFIILLLIIIIGGIGAKYYYDVNTKPVTTDGEVEVIEVDIPSGSSTGKIASILEDNNLIRNKNIFRIVSRLSDTDGKLKAGIYSLNSTMTPEEILDELVEGSRNRDIIKFTIPEGYTIEEMAERLSKENIVDKEKFLSLTEDVEKFQDDYEFLKYIPEGMNMEGYLFPQTYEVYSDANEEEIISKMLDEFEKVYNAEIKNTHIPNNLNLHKFVTISSLIEKEAKIDIDRPLVSSVIYNRISIDMPLQIDATIQFALEDRKEKLTYNDLEVDSGYNTYTSKGPPPGPIGSPGINSIRAALNPEKTNYIYYILKKDGSGEHFFTDDYNKFLNVKNSN